MQEDREYVLRLAHSSNVRFIRLWFTDILGFLKSYAITIDEFEDAINEGVRFDGTTMLGFIRANEREMLAVPDLSTFKILPWRPKEDSVARVFCDIYTTDMKPFEGDSRYVLKRNLQKAAEKGYSFYTGPEIEFFFFKNSNTPDILDRGGYFDLTPLDVASDLRRQIVLTLEEMGIGVISSHHEAANSQHEIDLRHEDALATADNIMTFKIIAKEISFLNGVYTSFMPKPLSNQNGSGMHTHQSLFKGEQNIFFDGKDPLHLSKTGKQYVAGILKHTPEFFAITNQWVNSYKRLQFGFESPLHISWGTGGHTDLVRIPGCRPDKPNSFRIELKNPDSSANPYLMFSALIASGLKGIEEQYDLPAPIDLGEKITSRGDIQRLGLQPVPSNLSEALKHLDQSALMRETLGDFIVDTFIENKMIEIEKYNSFITDYEIREYLPIL